VFRYQPHLGEATVASCVVFDAAGPVRAQYRRFNISGIEPGDDYAAMRQAIDRRFRRAVEEQGVLPDVLLIDGGAGQLAQAQAALADLGVKACCWWAWPRAWSAVPATKRW
jgi:excinuclease ABC subunit C